MSSTYTVTRDQIISLALRKLGVLEIGSVPDPDTISNAAMSLNLLIKQLSTEGLKLWKVSELVVPLTNGQSSYILVGSTSTLEWTIIFVRTLVFVREQQEITIPSLHRKWR